MLDKFLGIQLQIVHFTLLLYSIIEIKPRNGGRLGLPPESCDILLIQLFRID